METPEFNAAIGHVWIDVKALTAAAEERNEPYWICEKLGHAADLLEELADVLRAPTTEADEEGE